MRRIIRRSLSSKERLLCVLQHQEPDRIPIWMLFPRESYNAYVDVYNLPAYSEIAYYIRQHTDFFDRRSISVPFLFTSVAQFDHRTVVEDQIEVTKSTLNTPYGQLIQETKRNSRSSTHWRTKYLFRQIEDLEKALAIPYEPAVPDLSDFLAASKRLGDDGLMMMDLPTPVEFIGEYTAPEDFAYWIATEIDALMHFLDVVFEREYRWLEEALQLGAGPVFFVTGTEFVAPPLASPHVFAHLSTRYNQPLFELIHRYGCYVIVHHHGRIRAVLDQIVEAGADGIHPIEEPPIGDMPLAEAKQILAGRTTIVGSVQYDNLARLPDDEFEALIRRQIRDAAPGGGFILAPTAGPYEAEITSQHVRNLRRMVDLARELGTYPLSTNI
jgi:uroporphyrinogen-III decarboxylase